ncbi:MAG: hypothetical protein KC731_24135, partial [Myxococcales bacterium]|nr:hypothetical protein [Myxococcales bacterium]
PPPSFIGEAREGCKPGAAGAFLEAHPPPSPAHAATCHALAGDAEAARQALADLDDGERREAAGVVFGLIHPIADAGDEEAAGIGMELVLELWPENYQARYHAGLFAYGRGRDAEARAHLERFVAEYRNDDGFRQRALRALAALDAITRGETTARPALSAH